MAVRKDPRRLDESLLEPGPPIDDEGRERLRNLPGTRYRKRDPSVPPRVVEPWVTVIEPVDVLWLLGRRP